MHLSVITIITLLLLAGYTLFAPSSEVTVVTVQGSGVKMRIEQANWGLNCNKLYPEMKRQEEERLKNSPTPNEKSKFPAAPLAENNVLTQVKKLCEGKEKCVVPATSDALGEVFPQCSKELEISWRCFSYDTLHTKKSSNGEAVSIACATS